MMARALALLACLLLAACASAMPREDAPPPPGDPLPAAMEPDRSCEVDADCAVKNVGNCCGYYPACVNRQAETFPDQVKLACEREGRMSICGFPEIESCRCVAKRCEPASAKQDEVM